MRNILAGAGVESTSVYIVAGWASQQHISSALEASIKGTDLTRAGIRRAAANVDVSSDQMMPIKNLGRDGGQTETYVGVPTADNLSGINTLAWPYTGPTAAARDWTAGPCS